MADRTRTLLLGLIGQGIGGSLTPQMQMEEGAAQGLRLLYQSIDLAALELSVEALPELLVSAERMGFAGLNITFPCKQAVLPLLDGLSEEAQSLGAVNTVVFKKARRIGHNTDCSGYAEAFRRRLGDAPRRRVVQLGAGGAGAAVAHALLAEGVGELALTDTDPAKAAALVEGLRSRFGAGRARLVEALALDMAAADGLVNCTPIGMAKLPGTPIDVALLHPRLWVSEVIYVPLETALLRAARALGCRTSDGGGMAVFQAVGAFRHFTGLEPDAQRMEAHFARLTA
jgi:shikimate dehydrogenase